jgi:hypothetical protein
LEALKNTVECQNQPKAMRSGNQTKIKTCILRKPIG